MDKFLLSKSKSFEKSASAILVVAALLTIVFTATLVTNPPTFSTDLDDFTPQESESVVAHERIHNYFPNESRPMFVHITSSSGNVLTIENLQQMDLDEEIIRNESQARQDLIVSWTTGPGIIEAALEDAESNLSIQEISTWTQLVDEVVDDDIECELTSDDRLLSAATYASSALLNQDLDVNPICEYLAEGQGDSVPTASSLLWVLEVDPDLDSNLREVKSNELRDEIESLSREDGLSYRVVSLDLISHDIDEGTFDNLTLLIIIAFIVVTTILAITFKSFKGVVFPLTALGVALVWTYGCLNLVGYKFTALEVAVAPLVLGLGIDYSIHLQRAYTSLRQDIDNPSEAWLKSCSNLSMPLGLAVVTTVAAFLANLVSPLSPVANFGIALALGVICAFVASTLVVGALHVKIDGLQKVTSGENLSLPLLTKQLVSFQTKQQFAVILMTIIISIASIFGALSLTTEFDLTDFLDDDLEVMKTSNQLQTEYESAGWKLVYILIEPETEGAVIADSIDLLDHLRLLHFELKVNSDVVGTSAVNPSPSYDGIYVVLRDAIIQDEQFGLDHSLEVYDGDVLPLRGVDEIDLVSALIELSDNETLSDPVSGKTWSQRVENTVNIEDGEIKHLRIEVRVDASTSEESARVIADFQEMVYGDGKISTSLDGVAIVYVTGDLVTLQSVLDGLSISQLESTLLSLAASLGVLFILTRKFVPALVILTPVGLAAIWVVGSMALMGLSWNVLTVMVTALSLGIGIDFSIHMWKRLELELERNDVSREEALASAMSTTGVALIMSGLTTSLGFMVLIFSPMPVIQDFGVITAVTVAFALLLTLFVLPVLVELTENKTEAN
tara:strand:+ start:7545 stop:10082 length:2538 start_codon:yes stop_codon:yes gene_type:complete